MWAKVTQMVTIYSANKMAADLGMNDDVNIEEYCKKLEETVSNLLHPRIPKAARKRRT